MATKQEYIHTPYETDFGHMSKTAQLIPYKGRQILVWQSYQTKDLVDDSRISPPEPYTTVAGIVTRYKYKMIGDNKDIPVTEVETIAKEERAGLEKIVQSQGFEGPIDFWQ
jgi:hypothetical protein